MTNMIKKNHTTPPLSQGESSGGNSVSPEHAERIMGRENFLGQEDIEAVFGIHLESVPQVSFSREELERAKELGQQLILQVDTLKDGLPLTLQNLKRTFPKTSDGNKLWYDQDWYDNEDFFKNETPRLGWKLVSKATVHNTTHKNYLDQTETLIEHIRSDVFKDTTLPQPYAQAILEFEQQKAEIARLNFELTRENVAIMKIDFTIDTWSDDWKEAALRLSALAITTLTRESPVEVLYRLIVNDCARHNKLLPLCCSWTGRRDSDGRFVFVGTFDGDGVYVHSYHPSYRSDLTDSEHYPLGACLSRMG